MIRIFLIILLLIYPKISLSENKSDFSLNWVAYIPRTQVAYAFPGIMEEFDGIPLISAIFRAVRLRSPIDSWKSRKTPSWGGLLCLV